MRILVTGANGQLGSELRELTIGYPGDQFNFLNRVSMPFESLSKVLQVVEDVKPDLIINAAAYTAVDKAESEIELVDIVNHQAVAILANWTKENKKRLIHISTDYVFQGDKGYPLKEDVPTAPINVYGLSKQKAEEAIISSGADAIVIRTAWVYSSYGSNFVKTMMRLMKERDEISVISDQIGSPTYARDLAQVIMDIVHNVRWVNGIYHFSNEGEISWYDFAVAIREIQKLECKIKPISSEQYPTAARRPKYSLLDKTKIRNTFGVKIPKWRDSLAEMLAEM